MTLLPASRRRTRGIRGKTIPGSVLGLILIASLTYCTPGVHDTTPAPSIPAPQEATPTIHPSLGTPVLAMRGGLPLLEVALASETDLWSYGGGPMADFEVQYLDDLSAHGYRIGRTILWWNYLPGYNLLDVYYDDSIRQRLDMLIDFHFYGAEPGDYYGQPAGEEQPWMGLNPQDLGMIVIGDEGPGGFRDSQFYGMLSEDILRYAEVYHAETGYTLKPLDQMTWEEEVTFREWLNGKTVWVLNYIYDYVKSRWPHLQVFQYTLEMAPIWGFTYDRGAPYELKADGFVSDCYYATKNPWLLYETIRRYRAVIPDQPFYTWLWGVIWDFSQMEGGQLAEYREGSLEQFRREAWIAYLAGADAIGWFDWGPQGPGSENWRWGWERTDPQGRQVFAYTDLLSRELGKLPVLRAQPVVLGVGAFSTELPMPNLAEIGIFNEYDAVNGRGFAAASLDLSRYRLIVVAPGRYREEMVAKLNAYVEGGGNVVFLGGLGNGRNFIDTGARETRFQIENQATESFESGRIRIAISQPNLLGLELAYDGIYHESYVLQFDPLSENYHPIGGFDWVKEDGALRPFSGSPLVLYHDESKPESGWVLYWGALQSRQTDDQDREDKSDLYYLHQQVFRAFANFIGIGEAVASPETQDMIITQGLLENGMLLAGIDNLRGQERSLTYRVDLSRFGLSSGEYRVYSLDEGVSLGSFITDGTMLEIPLMVAANGIRLLLISTDPYDPAFSVDIFPEIPDLNQ